MQNILRMPGSTRQALLNVAKAAIDYVKERESGREDVPYEERYSILKELVDAAKTMEGIDAQSAPDAPEQDIRAAMANLAKSHIEECMGNLPAGFHMTVIVTDPFAKFIGVACTGGDQLARDMARCASIKE